MSNTGTQINKLLNTPSAPAPEITKPLKIIGDGNMFDGFRNAFNYAFDEGYRRGIIKGSFGILVGLGTICLGYKGFVYLKNACEAKEKHDEMGEKIYDAFQKESKLGCFEESFNTKNWEEETKNEETV